MRLHDDDDGSGGNDDDNDGFFVLSCFIRQMCEWFNAINYDVCGSFDVETFRLTHK